MLAGGVQPYVAERLICTTSDSMLWHYNVEAALVHVPKQVSRARVCAVSDHTLARRLWLRNFGNSHRGRTS